MQRVSRILCASMLVFSAIAAASCDAIPMRKSSASQRAMWVTRFDYKTRDDVLRVVEACEMAGINTILFQVRGNATALYRSSYEPWAEQFDFKDPGFDPLAVALEAAHKKGIEVHAWVNVIPAWWGTEPPADPAQVYNKHPEWMWYDQEGKRQALQDKFYVSVNPCLPEVRKYLVTVMRDIVGRYPIDGLHLDYMRFPNEPPVIPAGSRIDYPRDKATVALFSGETDHAPDEDRTAWDRWRSEQLNDLLRDIHHMVQSTKPSVALSVTTAADPEKAKAHFQDVKTWLDEDLVDTIYPMNYTRDMALFRDRVATWRELAPDHAVVMGVRLDSTDVNLHKEQLETVRRAFHGYAIFAYSSLFDSPNEAIDEQTDEARSARQDRRKRMLPMLRDLAY